MIKEIFGKKIGMTQIFNEEGNLQGVTLVEVDPVGILEEINYPKKKVVKIGCFKLSPAKAKKVKKPVLGYFNKLGVPPYKYIREVIADDKPFPGEDKAAAPVKDSVPEGEAVPEKDINDKKVNKDKEDKNKEVGVDIFKEGEIINVRARSKGKGFCGGMRRHGWSGQPKSHGSMTHRRIGSAGSSSFPSRIIKGLHMPGHMGNAYRTVKNLKIGKIDKDKNLVFINGSIPGSRGTVVKLIKR